MLNQVRKEEERTKYTVVQSSVQTRWGSSHDKCVCANRNQFDLNETIIRLVSEHGVDEKMYKEHMKTHGHLNNAIILPHNWDFYQQYEGDMQPVRDMITFCQSAQVIVHEELFEARRLMELLSLPYLKCLITFLKDVAMSVLLISPIVLLTKLYCLQVFNSVTV